MDPGQDVVIHPVPVVLEDESVGVDIALPLAAQVHHHGEIEGRSQPGRGGQSVLDGSQHAGGIEGPREVGIVNDEARDLAPEARDEGFGVGDALLLSGVSLLLHVLEPGLVGCMVEQVDAGLSAVDDALERREQHFHVGSLGPGITHDQPLGHGAFRAREDAEEILRVAPLRQIGQLLGRELERDIVNPEGLGDVVAGEVDGDSLVWFGTEAGLHKYDKSKKMNSKNAIKFYSNQKNHFNGDGDAVSISAILTEQNYLWIGTDEFITPKKPNYNIGGLYKFNRRNKWARYNNTDGFPGNGIYALEITGNYIWISLYQFSKNSKEEYGRGLALINRLNGKVTLLSEERLPRTIFALYFDGEKMWLGSDEGLYSINFINSLSEWNSGD